MRTVLFLILSACATITLARGQQSAAHRPSRTELLNKLRSESAKERSKAYEQLRSDPAALRNPTVKTALVNLLDRENQVTISGDEEDYAEYVSALAADVASFADWSDPRQVCVLVNSGEPEDQIAGHAKAAIPCLLQRSESRTGLERGTEIALLVQALPKGRSDLDPSTIQTVHQAILNALQDPDEDVKIPTVKALESFGGTDMIPALRVVAETDPDPAEGHAIRRWAAEAISAIQKRAGQH